MTHARAFTLFYIPHVNAEVEPYHSLFNGSVTLDQFYTYFSERIDAVNDDSPYHFNFEHGIPKILGELMILSFGLAVAFIVVPVVLSYKRRHEPKESHQHSNAFSSFILYFSALGMGYMLVEIALIQKFILFLGYPVRALAVTLFSLILSSGVGSYVSNHFACMLMQPIQFNQSNSTESIYPM